MKDEDRRVADLERRMAALENAVADQFPWFRLRFPGYYLPGAPVVVGPATLGCPVCDLGADGRPLGYVCTRADCPSRVVCG